MIKVTVGEQKTQEKIPFPKLMISDLGQIILATSVNEEREDLLVGTLIISNGYSIGGDGFTQAWCRSSFTDFNEPITLQNVLT